MKHEEISYQTKMELVKALKEEMKKKSFSKITVSDLVSDCNMNRKTFYYHFDNIYDLLRWMFEQEAIEIVKKFDFLVDYNEAINFVLDYVDKNDYIINCAYSSIGRDEMKNFFFSDFIGMNSALIDNISEKYGFHYDEEYKEFVAKFFSEAVAGTLIDMVHEKDKEKRKRYAQYIVKIVKSSVENVELQSKLKSETGEDSL